MIADLRALISNAFQVCALLGVAWAVCNAFILLDWWVSQ